MRAGGTGTGLALLALVASVSLPACNLKPPQGGLTQLNQPPELANPVGSYLELGRQYLRAGELRLAKTAFLRSLRLEGTSATALTGAGIAAERQGLLHEAQRYFLRAKEQAPESIMAHNNLGAVAYKLGDFHKAKQAFQAAFALSSGENRIAAHNLQLSELALRQQEETNVPVGRNPRPIQREGSGEYRILSEDPDLKSG